MLDGLPVCSLGDDLAVYPDIGERSSKQVVGVLIGTGVGE